MTSESIGQPAEAYVWVWLPGSSEPVVAGRIESVGDLVEFNYGRSYLAREDAIPLYLPELPLVDGVIPPLDGLTVAGCLADAEPDAWGQRVIMNRLLGVGASDADPAVLGPLTYLLESGSDRTGALDFQASPDRYVARSGGGTLGELLEMAEHVEQGIPLSPDLERALLHGSSIGGARPKAALDDGDRKLIAKFSSTTDTYSVVKGEYVAMELARLAGLEVAPVELANVSGKDVLLVERFDRGPGREQRRALVSALTILGLDPVLGGRYASYADLAQAIRERFAEPRATLRELFARIVFNILAGNTDDHARNHSAFWDGRELALTPAYDICPQSRGGGEASQAMAIGPDGFRMSQVEGCVGAAASYLISEADAREIVDRQIDTIECEWDDVCDRAELSATDRAFFWRRQFLNPYALEGYRRA